MDSHANDCRIGVYVCSCGTNIAKIVDCDAVTKAVADLPGVAVTRSYKYMCSTPGQEMIVQDIQALGFDRIVVAACSPRMHEPTFRRALQTGGINPYFLEMANIREQCSWVHSDRDAATEKATALTRAAVRRVVWHEPLEKRYVDMCATTLVLGGGIAGLSAALELADADQPVVLVEKAAQLGGNLVRVDLTAPHLDSARDLLADRRSRVLQHSNIRVLLRSELEELCGYVGNFTARIRTSGELLEVPVGSVIVCTGYKAFDASQIEYYGYGRLPNVITSFEFERMLRDGRILTRGGRVPRCVAIVHCVGSRSPRYHPYCSRVCCMTALKYGHEIKSAIPDSHVYDLYIDMHAFGKGCEDFYKRTAEVKTMFLMYGKNDCPQIVPSGPEDDCEMLIRVREQLSGEEIEVPADLVVLMVGMEARDDAARVARVVNISQDKDGWFIESHPKLDPVATTTDGVYIAGACQAPKGIPSSVAQAEAAAARILARIARGKLEIDAVCAEVQESLCSGCRVCSALCPYSAIEYDPARRRSSVISAVCKACGCCVAACPAGAIQTRHFTDQQINAEIDGLLETTGADIRVVAFLCNWCSYTGADLAGTSRIQYQPNVRVIRVMCSARVDPTFVLKALAAGADGVLVCGCHPGDCHYTDGNHKTLRRMRILQRMLSDCGIESERVRLEWVSASEGKHFAEVVDDMIDRIRKLGPLWHRPAFVTEQVETACVAAVPNTDPPADRMAVQGRP